MKWFRDDTEFQREWNRNFLTLFLPGFLIFGLGGVAGSKFVALAGWGVAALGGFKAFRLIVKYRTCPDCGSLNSPRLNSDDCCIRCGGELPLDGTD